MDEAARRRAKTAIERYLSQNQHVRHTSASDAEWTVWLPDVDGRSVEFQLRLSDYSLFITGFFMRAPEDNVEEVYRFLLRKNLEMRGAKFGLNDVGDIFLSLELPISSITEEELDRQLGQLYSNWQQSYGTVLKTGWAKYFKGQDDQQR